MAKKPIKKVGAKTNANYVVITSRSYGKALKGTKVYFEGKKPASLKKDGSIAFGKNILELIKKEFQKFQWIITEDVDSITTTYGISRVRTSMKTLRKIQGQLIDRNRDIKLELLKNTFSVIYPDHFRSDFSAQYTPGTLANVLTPGIIKSLSSDDKDALNKFLPTFISSESISSVNLLKANAQIQTLKELAEDFKRNLKEQKSESWWQTYIKKNILIIQQGYIQSIEKMNVTIGNTKFPDFSLITHDNFLDILEIKKPATPLIKLDTSRDNFYWEPEISKAIIQTENYIENVSKHSDAIRSYILDSYKINLKVVRPRGIILAGNTADYGSQKQKDDFRLLTQSIKNITFVTYDELLTRLENYIEVLEKFSVK